MAKKPSDLLRRSGQTTELADQGLRGCWRGLIPGLSGLVFRCFIRFGWFDEDEFGGLAGDVFHFGDQAAQFALVGDPFGVAGGLGIAEPPGDGFAGDFAGELVGAVGVGRAGVAAAAWCAAGGVAAGEAAGDGEAELAEAGGQYLVAAA